MGRLDNEVLKRILSKEFNAVSVSAPGKYSDSVLDTSRIANTSEVTEAQVAPSSVSDPLILVDYVYNTLPLLNLVDTPSEAPSFPEGQSQTRNTSRPHTETACWLTGGGRTHANLFVLFTLSRCCRILIPAYHRITSPTG